MKLLFSIFILLLSTTVYSSQCQEKNIPLKQFKEGDLAYFKYANSSINIYHRTKDEINALKEKTHLVKNALENSNKPDTGWPSDRLVSKEAWATDGLRSINKKYFVFWSNTPSNDCNLIHIDRDRKDTEGKLQSFLNKDWPGGFFDPCYGVGYNYSGYPILKATYENQPDLEKRATFNLLVPEYTIVNKYLHIQSCSKNEKP